MMQAAMQMMQNPAMVQSMQQLLGGAVQGPGRQVDAWLLDPPALQVHRP